MLQESAGPLELPRLTYGDLYKKNRIMGSKLASVMKVKANIGHSHQLSPYCFHSNTENTLSKPTHLGGQNSNRTQSGKSAKSMTQHGTGLSSSIISNQYPSYVLLSLSTQR